MAFWRESSRKRMSLQNSVFALPKLIRKYSKETVRHSATWQHGNKQSETDWKASPTSILLKFCGKVYSDNYSISLIIKHTENLIVVALRSIDQSSGRAFAASAIFVWQSMLKIQQIVFALNNPIAARLLNCVTFQTNTFIVWNSLWNDHHAIWITSESFQTDGNTTSHINLLSTKLLGIRNTS